MIMPPSYKLKPIPTEKWGDWYRGNKHVTWDLKTGKGRGIEMFATECGKCHQWWGWSPLLEQIVKVRDAMAKMGCPKCRKKRERVRESPRRDI